MSQRKGLFSRKNDLGEKNCHNLMVYFLPKKEKEKVTSQEKVACVVAIWKKVCNLPILPRIPAFVNGSRISHSGRLLSLHTLCEAYSRP
jgi:hypothetical protein